ncbi:MAG: ATP-binding cassette domain-containing protein [Clostridia bacterium]|nr:ATP-binding cassette domain-containing protein [Oscillospiraceae bacterium]MBQ3760469.1 ATP-binding cassette domain-containing protein [Clostridia bacterium]
MACIEINGLSFTYPAQTQPALRDITLSVREGEFTTLIGASGSGKSTLLRMLKPTLTPHGEQSGSVELFGTPLSALDQRTASAQIGFVLQDADSQSVTDKVWHELAFGAENLGMERAVIQRRIAETAAFFGMEDWLDREIASLSGGQKQLLNLAAVMVLQPRVLLLDEPTAQLDPIAATEFLNAVHRICRELGTTVILSEQRLEEVLPLSERVIALERGTILSQGSPLEVAEALKTRKHPLYLAMPTPIRLCGRLTVGQARRWLSEQTGELKPLPERKQPEAGETAIELKHVGFRYEKKGRDVLRELSCRFERGRHCAVHGGNGSGKTTLLSLICGLQKPQQGKLVRDPKLRVGLLPQDPKMLFVSGTVRGELEDAASDLPQEEREARTAEVTRLCKLEGLLERHPYDLSGGEQQRTALAKVLLSASDILLLDEPTKGCDAAFKTSFGELLRALVREGKTVITVSHDVEFCAVFADCCYLLFDGAIAAEGTPAEFFSGNSFYTTAANRIARRKLPEAVTCAELLEACGVEESDFPADDGGGAAAPAVQSAQARVKPLPWWRVLIALAMLAGAAFFAVALFAPLPLGLSKSVQQSLLAVCLAFLPVCLSRRRALGTLRQTPVSRTRVVAGISALLLVPATILCGVYLLNGRQVLLVSLLVLTEIMLPFALAFERRRPQAYELVLLAVLSALAVAGRTAFSALPQFKPVLALVIISGVALGAESGFLIGALSMLLSNVFFGQGPWTPWQMFAMGLVGFLAGFLYRRGILRCSRASLCIFGAIVSVVVYGFLMNVSSAFTWYSDTLSWKAIVACCVSGFPMDFMQSAATAAFLWLFAAPLLDKLDRVRVKYGIMKE